MTRDTWHMTCDMWGKGNVPSKFLFPGSYRLEQKVFWRYFHKGWLFHWINQSMNYNCVCKQIRRKLRLLTVFTPINYLYLMKYIELLSSLKKCDQNSLSWATLLSVFDHHIIKKLKKTRTNCNNNIQFS